MPPAAPDQPASSADERPDAPAREADGAAAGSRSPSRAPSDAEARPARVAAEATSTRTTGLRPENDPPRPLTLPINRRPSGPNATPLKSSYRHLQVRIRKPVGEVVWFRWCSLRTSGSLARSGRSIACNNTLDVSALSSGLERVGAENSVSPVNQPVQG